MENTDKNNATTDNPVPWVREGGLNSPAPTIEQLVGDKGIDPCEIFRQKIADQFEKVARMLRNDKLKKVIIDLDGSGNQKVIVDDTASQRQYIAIIRTLPGVIEEPEEPIGIRFTRTLRMENVKELHRQGYSQKQIAEKLNVSQQTISNDLQKIKETEENNDK